MDTIAAISTIAAPSAIGVLRMTGPGTKEILDRVFRPANGRPMSRQQPRQMVYGSLLDREGRVIDDALAVCFEEGRSYTGEASGEIHCHGSPIVLQEGLQALFAAGARQARGGEFTRRAFLNGRMDLTQAEAVIDLIEAETPQAARNAVGQVEGVLRRRVEQIYQPLMEDLSRFYAVVDYPDEDIEELSGQQLHSTLAAAQQNLEELLSTFDRGRILREGVPTVILGRPNVGKSSLLNALLGYDRAIVTEIPGTTRDTVEEKINAGGVLLRLCDTAGIRATCDPVEKLGVERALASARRASLALLVLDASQPLTEEDKAAIEAAAAAEQSITILNKSDLPQKLRPEQLPAACRPAVSLSAKSGAGLQQLEAAIAAAYPAGAGAYGQVLSNARQTEAASRALAAVRRGREALEAGLTPDAVLSDGEEALAALGELNGKKIREDLVDTIFSRFCVGK